VAEKSRTHLISNTERRMPFEATDVHTEGAAGFEPSLALLSAIETYPPDDAAQVGLRPAESPASGYASTKRLLDILGALVLATVFSPLVLAIVAIMGCEKGPIIYRHRRVGREGRFFECLKFRTMIPNADQVLRELLESDPKIKAEWMRDHKLRRDPRVTRLGRFLRRTSLDELPQLWNVIRGEMSLVGPRPVVREELLRYGRNVRTYLAAKPGITGLWQIKGRNDTDYHRRVVLDTYYVRNQNLLLDVYILFKTTRVVLGGSGAYYPGAAFLYAPRPGTREPVRAPRPPASARRGIMPLSAARAAGLKE
jgi:exopolysaccharide production protein ExoY